MLNKPEEQINQCLNLLSEIFGNDLLGVYLYGSAIVGGLQKYSDLDLFVVTNRATSHEEKLKLVNGLLKISGIYMKSADLPIEITFVVKSEVNPWRYPPKFDFQYGEWLRKQFEDGNVDIGPSKEMPDLAILITKVLLASKTLIGSQPNQLLCIVPYMDFMAASTDSLESLTYELESDTRNVLLTLARIWNTVETDTICSKPAAADWSITHLPENFQPVMKRAKAICKGLENEYWDDMKNIVKPCANFMATQIHNRMSQIKMADNTNKLIMLAKDKT